MGSQWAGPLVVLREMREAGVMSNVISFNAAISACEKGSHWEEAQALLREMQDTGLKHNMIRFYAVTSPCHRDGHCLYDDGGVAANAFGAQFS